MPRGRVSYLHVQPAYRSPHRPAKVIDGDAIVVGQLIGLHGMDAPELNERFWWRGQHIGCGTISSAALEALIAGVGVRCEVVEWDRHGRRGLLAQWRRYRPQIGARG
jgi:endonuclease YncB( thermonuclease family)